MKTMSLQTLHSVFDQLNSAVPALSVIAQNRTGYALKLDMGKESYEITGNDGEQLHFRTMEHLLNMLVDIPELAPAVRLDFSDWFPMPEYT